MLQRNFLLYVCLAVLVAVGAGCAHAARDTTGFAQEQQTTLEAPFEPAWQAVKEVLREEGLELYTRDKRGTFVAYTPMKRSFFQPRRVKYTILLKSLDDGRTQVDVSAVRQIYGVTLLTYPDWHDRKTTSGDVIGDLLEAIRAKAGEAGAAAG